MKNHNTLSEAIQNGPGTISTRLIILTVLPALFGFSIWSGERLVTKLDEIDHKVEINHVEVLQLTGKLESRVTGAEHDILSLQHRAGP